MSSSSSSDLICLRPCDLPTPGSIQRYEDFFGAPVCFGAERNAIAIRSDMLDLSTRLGNAAVSRFLTEHLDAELGALTSQDSVERILAEHLSDALSNGIPKASAVARSFGMSERTLYRRLSESGQAYQEVLESTQRSLAKRLLSQPAFSIPDIAFLTGFSEQSSFNRAFKRWVGQTPGAYRRATSQIARSRYRQVHWSRTGSLAGSAKTLAVSANTVDRDPPIPLGTASTREAERCIPINLSLRPQTRPGAAPAWH